MRDNSYSSDAYRLVGDVDIHTRSTLKNNNNNKAS